MEYLDYTSTKKNIIELLKKLGYKSIYLMDLYSEWIYEIMNYLQSINSRDEIYSCKEYIACMKNGLSQYYVWLVREGMWLGIIPFHSNMEKMVDEIDYSLADEEELSKVYGNIDFSIDYADNAFLLAAYLLGKKDCSIIKENHPKILKLKGMSERIERFNSERKNYNKGV